MIDRHKFAGELKLRHQIRKTVKIMLEKQKIMEQEQLLEERKLRKIVQQLLLEREASKPQKTPHENTGINALQRVIG